MEFPKVFGKPEKVDREKSCGIKREIDLLSTSKRKEYYKQVKGNGRKNIAFYVKKLSAKQVIVRKLETSTNGEE